MNKKQIIKTGIVVSVVLGNFGAGLSIYSKHLNNAAQSKTSFPLVQQKEALEDELKNTSFNLYSLVSNHIYDHHRIGSIPRETVDSYTAHLATLTDEITSIASKTDYDQQDRTVRALKERSSTYDTLHHVVSALGT